ncbi:MAG TPA: AMP-binding protein [Rhizobiaceae bacterium]|nr:AMP-binding protein [Rhizobiaceae bacterium]
MEAWYSEALTTWGKVLDAQAERLGDKTLFIEGDRSLSYADFRARVDELAKGLIALGVKKGDVAAIWMTNNIDWVVCQFAIYKTGAQLLPLYSYYKQSELEYALRQGEIAWLVMADRFIGKIDALAIATDVIPELATARKDSFRSEAFPMLRAVISVREEKALASRYRVDEIVALGKAKGSDAALNERLDSIDPFDVMNIMYTSGTTGFPKGGLSMHVTNLVTTWQWAEIAGLGEDDVILCHVPLFTNFGGLYAAALGIRNGSAVVITEQFDAALSLRMIEEHGVTYIPGTPSMFRMMIDHEDIKTRNLSSVRGGHVAGAPLTESTMHEIIEVFGAREIMQAWGLSECGGLSTVSTRKDPVEKRLKTVGKPLASAKVIIAESGSTAPLAKGSQGEILLGDVRPGSCVGKGYHLMPEKTASAITTDGWFRTGDVGFFDEDGYLHITGRVDDMFTVGGFNIYPAEIEAKLEQLDGVREAFIVPLEDRRLGNVPVAWVAREEGSAIGEENIIAHVRSNMTSQKVPRRVFFYESGELPMTPVGKVKKKELTKQTAERVAREQVVSGAKQ